MTINWGIIGCGNVTEVKSGPAFNLVPGSRLVAVMRRDAEKARDYAVRHNVPAWYSNAADLINDPEVNAVYVATPPSTHAEYAIEAMRAGKNVYVEKPMALNADECREMIKVSGETGRMLFVAYYRRALPYFLKIKDLIDSGVIGNVLNFDLTLHNPLKPEEIEGKPGWRLDPSISGGGHFHDLASHQIDYLEYLLGPVENVKGYGSNITGLYSPDDNVTAMFRFGSGILGNGSWCFCVPEILKKDETIIRGTKGSLSFTFFGTPEFVIRSEKLSDRFTIPLPPHIQQPLIELIVKNIRGEGTSPSTGMTGMRATMIMGEIVRQM